MENNQSTYCINCKWYGIGLRNSWCKHPNNFYKDYESGMDFVDTTKSKNMLSANYGNCFGFEQKPIIITKSLWQMIKEKLSL